MLGKRRKKAKLADSVIGHVTSRGMKIVRSPFPHSKASLSHGGGGDIPIEEFWFD